MAADINFGLSQLKQKTPTIIKNIGHGLLGVSIFISGYSFYNQKPYIGIVGLLCGCVGKFICECFGSNPV